MRVTPFNQPAPTLGNQYDDDRVLRSYLKRVLPPAVFADIEPELREMGALSGGELYAMQLEDRLNEPTLTQWNAWGERIDQIEVSPLWKRAERIAAERGVVATGHEKKHGRHARVHQFALAYLFTPSTDIYSCPLAMTDGAATTLAASDNEMLKKRALPHLLSRDPATFWTSGQWMTESTGGSDVGRSETIAEKHDDGTWHLHGRKWFTSATTSQMTLTLARPETKGPGSALPGSHGLALFYVETRDDKGRLANIEIGRLKDKLGTRKVPTAELYLHGTRAELVAGVTDGVRQIGPMLNITRTWNSVCALAAMRRGIALARDYARKRTAFGATLMDKPLHTDTLAGMQAEFEAAFHFTFFVVELLGKNETGELDPAQAKLLRLLTPLVKLTTGKQAVAVTSETLECFGGAGFVEDTGLPTLLRDAQVLPIWEGTTNVLSLDVLRVIAKDEALPLLVAEIEACAAAVKSPELKLATDASLAAIKRATKWLVAAHAQGGDALEAGARRFALTLGRASALAMLARHAEWALAQGDTLPALAAARFLDHGVDLMARELATGTASALARDSA